jgi:hypothetical protein
MRRSPGSNIHGVFACDCSVQCAIPKGRAAIGSVLPRENVRVESLPCKRLTSETGPLVVVEGEAASIDFLASALLVPTTAAPATRLEDLRNDLRFNVSYGLFTETFVSTSENTSVSSCYPAYLLVAQP